MIDVMIDASKTYESKMMFLIIMGIAMVTFLAVTIVISYFQ